MLQLEAYKIIYLHHTIIKQHIQLLSTIKCEKNFLQLAADTIESESETTVTLYVTLHTWGCINDPF